MTAAITLTDNANSPQTVALSGSAISSTTTGTTTVYLSLNNLYFYNRAVGSASAPESIVLINTGNNIFNLTSMVVTGSQPDSFLVSSTCGSELAIGASCTISVSFLPQIVGANSANIVLTDNAGTGAQSFPLVGHGF
jgi:hypothetical protein